MLGLALILDAPSAQAITVVQAQLTAAGLPPPSLNAGPHVALALATGLEVSRVVATIENSASLEIIDLTLGSMGLFPERQLFLGMTVTPELIAMRRVVTSAVVAAGGVLETYSRDDDWVPHISMTGFLDARAAGRAVRVAGEIGWPRQVRATELRLSEIPSLATVRTWHLG